MKKPFHSFLSLDQIYVSPIVRQDDGSYKCLSYQEMMSVPIPETGCKLMDAVARALAIMPFRNALELADYMNLDVRKLSGAVDICCTLPLNRLIVAYRVRLVQELIQYTQLPRTEVAKRCGLASASILNHLLKMQLKTTFLELRSQYQEKIALQQIIYK